MGRMFRVISEKFEGGSAPTRAVPFSVPADVIPFVEVGGPEGLVTSVTPKAAPKPTLAPAVVPTVVAPTIVAKPPAVLAEYLSVQFHAATHAPSAGSDVAAELVAFHRPDHAVSGEYRLLKDEIRQQLREIGPKVLFFTAARPESGTTTVLLNTAITLAAESEHTNVVIVDADFDSPAAAKRLAAAEHHGLSDVLGNAVPLAWAVQPTTIPRVHVVPTGASELKAAALTDLPRILSQLKQSFDWVLVDAGRWGQRPDRDGAATEADAVYAVTRSTDLERLEFTGLRNRVAHAGGTLRGYVTTRT